MPTSMPSLNWNTGGDSLRVNIARILRSRNPMYQHSLDEQYMAQVYERNIRVDPARRRQKELSLMYQASFHLCVYVCLTCRVRMKLNSFASSPCCPNLRTLSAVSLSCRRLPWWLLVEPDIGPYVPPLKLLVEPHMPTHVDGGE